MEELWQEPTLEPELPGQLSFVPEAARDPQEPQGAGKYDRSEIPVSSAVSLEDPVRMRILLCDVLAHFDARLPADWLYDIAVGAGHFNYFLYCSTLEDMLSAELITEQNDTAGTDMYYLTEKGKGCAESFRHYVPKLFRDRVILTALRYVSRQKALKDLKISYEQTGNDWALCLTCSDRGREMLFLRIHAPNRAEAEALGERILRNPAGFFGKVLDLAVRNEEEQFDLTDN